ncbi:MAG: 1-deoxy-D-xylulose-5-phosphate reductoisomerase [Tunicatimonas sp.]
MSEEVPPRRLAIVGATGSIGTQALEVIQSHPQKFAVEVLTAHRNADLLIRQSRQFLPNAVIIVDEAQYPTVHAALDPLGIKVYTGTAALADVVTMDTIDLVLTATVGYSGLLPTIRAIEARKTIALANKETLVVAGGLVTQLAKEHGVSIYPVDSEHSAIFQCLVGEFHNPIEKVILTASGGPFRGKRRADLANVTKEQALKHPNWEMGAKVTIDSASLMNKGLEVIEAQWLFGLSPEQIEVVVHPQSIVHSLVQFADSSLKAQLGLPDMRVPIQYALSYPQRLPNALPRFNFLEYPELTFERPDTDTFRNLLLAFEAMRRGGNTPCVLNAANEVAVSEFLRGNIGFLDMSSLVERCMEKMPYIRHPNYEDYVATNDETRSKALELLTEFR